VKDDLRRQATGHEPVNAGKGRITLEVGVSYGSARRSRGSMIARRRTIRSRPRKPTQRDHQLLLRIPASGVARNAATGTPTTSSFGSRRYFYSCPDKAVNDSLVGATFAFPKCDRLCRRHISVLGALRATHGQLAMTSAATWHILLVPNLTDAKTEHVSSMAKSAVTYDDSGRRYFFAVVHGCPPP